MICFQACGEAKMVKQFVRKFNAVEFNKADFYQVSGNVQI